MTPRASASFLSPVGLIRIDAQPDGQDWAISSLKILPKNAGMPEPAGADGHTDTPCVDLLRRAIDQLAEYFAGVSVRFDLPLTRAASPFQTQLRQAMIDIPHGHTASYAEIARQIDSSPRAVGTGCGRNPIPVIVPCHRVLASTGIGGYSGGNGLETKRGLLALERKSLSVR